MECVIGIRTNDFCILAADTRSSRSICTMKHDEEKMFKFSSHLLAAVCGEAGDASQFAELMEQNMQLYEIRNGAAHFTRSNLAKALRSRVRYNNSVTSQNPYHVNLAIAGYGHKEGPELYYLDYLATLVKVPFVVHGYGSYMTLGVLDRHYNPNMTVEETVKLLKLCVQEIQKRLVINLDRYVVRLINKEGIHPLADLTDFGVSS